MRKQYSKTPRTPSESTRHLQNLRQKAAHQECRQHIGVTQPIQTPGTAG